MTEEYKQSAHRRAYMRDYCKRWRENHPVEWAKIERRHLDKKIEKLGSSTSEAENHENSAP